MTYNHEMLGRLRRDIGRLDALILIMDEIEDEETLERLERLRLGIVERTKLLTRDLKRIEKEIVRMSKFE